MKDSAKSAGGNHRLASVCRPHWLSEAGEAPCQIKSPCNASDLSPRWESEERAHKAQTLNFEDLLDFEFRDEGVERANREKQEEKIER